jgi:hypothetical protein
VDQRRAGLRLTWLGAATQVAGLGVDAALHAADESRAAREGVFTLANPGHALFVIGTGLVILGAFLSLIAPRLAHRRVLRILTPFAVVTVMATGTAFAATSSLAEGHDDGVATTEGTPAHATTVPPSGVVAPEGGTSGHGHGETFEELSMDRPTRDQLSWELTKAREAAMGHRTVAMALQDGYVMVVPYVPLIGAHYMKFSLVDGKFDVERPEMLLYDGISADSQIVGLSYYVAGTTEPPGFAGPNDHWHRHIGLCVARNRPVVIGGEKTTAEECAARGGYKADGSGFWMVHAWVVPGWDSPDGVFSAEHRGLAPS